ncbi:MAG: HD-GYP domain-containing protein [Sporolactobacillus sp.]
MQKTVEVQNLSDGMLLDQNIYINSTVLYHEGTYITLQMAEDLILHGVRSVRIIEDGVPLYRDSESSTLSTHQEYLLTERFQNDMAPIADELRYGHILHSESSYQWLHSIYLKLFSNPVIKLLMDTLKQWDPVCYTHSIDVFVLCSLFSRQSDWPLTRGFIAGTLLHDIGKLYTPQSILLKKGKLTEREYKQITKHPLDGSCLLEKLNFDEAICRIARSHHERLNGSGYPDHLPVSPADRELNLMMVADVYSALTLKRSYRNPMHATKAMEIILSDAFSKNLFDIQTCYRFIEFISIFPPATEVMLSNEHFGTVQANPKGSDILPRIKMDNNQVIQLPKDLSLTIRHVIGWDNSQSHLQAKQNWDDFIHFLIRGNTMRAMECLDALSDSKRVEDVFVDLFERSLNEIAAGRKNGQWTVIDELVARSTTITLLDWKLRSLIADQNIHMGNCLIAYNEPIRDVVFFKMVEHLLAINGWQTCFISEAVDETLLSEMIEEKHTEYICLSLSVPNQVQGVRKQIDSLLKSHPQLTIFVHGKSTCILAKDQPLNVLLSSNLTEFIANMAARFPRIITSPGE